MAASLMRLVLLCATLIQLLVSVKALPRNQESCGFVSWPESPVNGIFDWLRNPIFPGGQSISVSDCGGQPCRTDWPLNADGWRCVDCEADVLRRPKGQGSEAWKYMQGDLARDNMIKAWYHPSRVQQFGDWDFPRFAFFAFGEDDRNALDTQAQCSLLEEDRCQAPAINCGDKLTRRDDLVSPFGIAVMETLVRVHSAFRETDLAMQRVRSKMQASALEFVSTFAEKYDASKAAKDKAFKWDMINLSLDMLTTIPVAGEVFGVSSLLLRAGRTAEEAAVAVQRINDLVTVVKFAGLASKGARSAYINQLPGGAMENDPAEGVRNILEYHYQDIRASLKETLRALTRGDSRESLDRFFDMVAAGPPPESSYNTTLLEENWEAVEYAKLIQTGWTQLSSVHYRPFILAYPKAIDGNCLLMAGDIYREFREDGQGGWDIGHDPITDLPDFCYWVGGITDQSKVNHKHVIDFGDHHDSLYALPGHGSFDGHRFGGWTLHDVVLSSLNSWWSHGCTIPEDAEEYVMKDHRVTDSGVPEKMEEHPWTVIGRQTPGVWRLPIIYYSNDGFDGMAGNTEGLEDIINWVNHKDFQRLPGRDYGRDNSPGENGCPTHIGWIPEGLKELARKAPRRWPNDRDPADWSPFDHDLPSP